MSFHLKAYHFSKLCKSFVNNSLSVHFGDDKTKSILCGIKQKLRKVGKLHIKYQEFIYHYLGCVLDQANPGKPMAYKT